MHIGGLWPGHRFYSVWNSGMMRQIPSDKAVGSNGSCTQEDYHTKARDDRDDRDDTSGMYQCYTHDMVGVLWHIV